VRYVAVLNWFVPKALISALSVLETAIETILGVARLFGIWQRIVAWGSAGLLISFALTMSVALGVVAPLSYSVFTAFGGAFLLGAIAAPAEIIAEILHGVSFGGRTEEVSWRRVESPVERVRG
jgi:hypothetical protein